MADDHADGALATHSPLAELLTVTQRRMALELAAALAEEDSTLEQWRVLRALSDGDGHGMGELAASLVVPHASLTRIVEQLTSSGLAYRRQSASDRRRVTVHLSRQGRERLYRLDALVDAREKQLRSDASWERLAAALEAVRPPG